MLRRNNLEQCNSSQCCATEFPYKSPPISPFHSKQHVRQVWRHSKAHTLTSNAAEKSVVWVLVRALPMSCMLNFKPKIRREPLKRVATRTPGSVQPNGGVKHGLDQAI